MYLPPGYTTGERRYPVLYLNDGEAAFDGGNALHVNRICEDLIRSGEMEPIIVVAIETMSIENRWYDYTPWIDPYWPVRQGGGDAYIRAIRDTLKPEIDRRYRTLPDAGHTAMGGMSLGGLMSAYAGYYYDGTFGRVAAFSPTYGWGGDNLVHYAASHSKPRIVRFYQDTGTIGDNYIGEMRDVAIAQGFMEGQDFMSIVAEYATHTTPCWEHRFPGMLRFVFRP